jgi:hypothetical protein
LKTKARSMDRSLKSITSNMSGTCMQTGYGN